MSIERTFRPRLPITQASVRVIPLWLAAMHFYPAVVTEPALLALACLRELPHATHLADRKSCLARFRERLPTMPVTTARLMRQAETGPKPERTRESHSLVPN